MLYSGVDKPTVKRQSHQFCVLLLCLRNIELSCELSSAAEICDTVCDVWAQAQNKLNPEEWGILCCSFFFFYTFVFIFVKVACYEKAIVHLCVYEEKKILRDCALS